jgi:pimeloyl-ACP methyl ester carboxylesterase
MLAIVLIAVVVGFAYEQISRARDRAELTQIGQSIDLGGRTLNIFCSGTGSPAVIFESGAGLPGYTWVYVQREAARLTRACWYDRAGQGWSDSRPEPNWSDLAADDLHALLIRAELPPPYLLVAHSIGAFTARIYQGQHPENVAGMVLLDPSDAVTSAAGGSLASRLPAPIVWPLIYLARGLAQVGVTRIFAQAAGQAPSGITQQEWNTITRLRNQPRPFLSAIQGGPNSERLNLERIRPLLNANVGDIPLRVLQPQRASERRKQRLAELAKRSRRGEHILVPNTGHMVPWDAPDAVISHIRDVLERVENRVKTD